MIMNTTTPFLPTPTPTPTGLSELSTQQFEQCGTFWLSVASTIAWPTLITLLAFFYMKGTLSYSHYGGGKVEYSTVLGVVEHRPIAPGQLKEEPQAIVSSCCTHSSSVSYSTGGALDTMHRSETGFGSFALLMDAYPIRSFVWLTNSEEALNSSVQLVRRVLKKPVTEEEEISRSKLVISLIGFLFGLVGLLRKPDEIPDALRTIFTKGAVPDIRVFLLFSSVASVSSFLAGILTGLATFQHDTVHLATRRTKFVLAILWSLICLVSFVIGCIQINDRRVSHKPVWPMFIYWAPTVTIVRLNLWGFEVFNILAMVGVVLGIVAENQVSCRH